MKVFRLRVSGFGFRLRLEVCPGFSVSGFGFRVYLDGFAHAHLIGQNAALVLGALLLAKKKVKDTNKKKGKR